METPGIHIGSLGTFVPRLVTNESAEPGHLRGASLGDGTPAITMAVDAARQALERWGRPTDLLRLLLYVDAYPSAPEGWSPSAYLQRELLHGDMLSTGLRDGCNGVFSALELAAGQLMVRGGDTSALVVAAENLESPLVDRWSVLEGFTMSDVATAMVLSREPGFARLLSVTSGTVPELEQLHRGDEPLNVSGLTLGRPLDFNSRIREFGRTRSFTPETALLLFKSMKDVVDRALDEAGIGIGDVARVAMTNEPRRNVDERMKALGLPPEISTWDYGSTVGHSPSDQVLALHRLVERGELVPGQHLLMIGIGPGLTYAAAVVEITDTPDWASGAGRTA
ncbi:MULTISPECIES: ketoacyl-ACP synthase III family protein [unclassified Nocardiopsis]|uniref:ketoacyl-ACP synthase III family protein n=1 Tax=Nocardiopsis TaxID=2013 RepID=UPI00387B4261